jgi:aspartate kinase
LERIKNVAKIAIEARKTGKDIVAVVSAMAGVTNKFVEYARSLNTYEGDSEYDRVVSSGELITAGLLAMVLKNLGFRAKSYSSWQIPILTDSSHGRAVIQSVNPENIKRDLAAGIIPVVCGFQGISPENRITTLGRGGSDLTGVAIASAIKADLCEIYSDVDGVYTTDPNFYHEAKKIDEINYHEMLEMASQGAKILQEQSVIYAMRGEVVIRVASSFVDSGGTIISGRIPSRSFCGLAITPSLSQIRVVCGQDPRFCMDLLERHFIRAEILKNGDPHKMDILLNKKSMTIAMNILKNCDLVESAKQVVVRRTSSRISVVGSSMSAATADDLIGTLRAKKIEALGFTVTNHRISIMVSSDKLLESVALLHKHCGLGK